MSGQIGNIPCTFALAKGGIAAETAQVLRKYGLSRKDVRKCTVMLADIDEWGGSKHGGYRISRLSGRKGISHAIRWFLSAGPL